MSYSQYYLLISMCSSLSRPIAVVLLFMLFISAAATPGTAAQAPPSRKPALIRDTDTAEGKEEAVVSKPKEYSRELSAKNLKIGDYYFKRKNYVAAIQRYQDAIEYQPDHMEAYESLARAYEKNGDLAKAAHVYKDFIQKNPDSPKAAEIRIRLAKLEKK